MPRHANDYENLVALELPGEMHSRESNGRKMNFVACKLFVLQELSFEQGDLITLASELTEVRAAVWVWPF